MIGYLYALLVLVMIRNIMVFSYRQKLITKVAKKCDEDIDRGDFKWMWRYSYYESVSYWTMLFKFWKPLRKFYNLEILLGDKIQMPVKTSANE